MTRNDIPPALLTDVENYLNITWQDTDTDNKISNLIASASAYLDSKLGSAADYTADGLPRTLLFEYVRYARDSALDVFETNYRSMILAMQNEGVTAVYGVESTVSPTN